MAGIDLNKIAESKSKQSSKGASAGIVALLNKDISFGSKQLSNKKKESFYSELLILLEAGVDIKSAFELIESEQQKKEDKELFAEIRKQVVSGKGISEAMKESGKFSDYEYYSIKIGEKSSQLIQVLQQLRLYFEKSIKQRRQVAGALSYPLIVIVVAFSAVAFMISFVVPAFADIFKRFKSELPPITKFILSLSESFLSYVLIFVLIVLGCWLFYRTNREKEWMRKRVSSVILKIPVIGNLVQLTYLSRFCQSMSLLLSAKVHITEALPLVKKMINYYPIEVSLDTIEKDIMKGMPLNESMAKYSIYPRKMLYLIKVAEEVNQQDKIFSRLSQQYSDEVEHKSGLISTIIEPILIVFLGFMVAFILVAMYLPMFSLTNVMG
ncbi:MAG: type II secretion system F family protein [Bacteroidetes bacterium]|nr:type II secretion system F family protein [Bacteroidota bacterium]